MPVWPTKSVVLAIHELQLAEHGGAPGLRDEGALEFALARPRNRSGYEEADLYELAAAYAFGIARNHSFVDGNKRVSEVVTMLFLELNGIEAPADEAAIVETWMAIADGGLDEAGIAAWLRRTCRPFPAGRRPGS